MSAGMVRYGGLKASCAGRCWAGAGAAVAPGRSWLMPGCVATCSWFVAGARQLRGSSPTAASAWLADMAWRPRNFDYADPRQLKTQMSALTGQGIFPHRPRVIRIPWPAPGDLSGRPSAMTEALQLLRRPVRPVTHRSEALCCSVTAPDPLSWSTTLLACQQGLDVKRAERHDRDALRPWPACGEAVPSRVRPVNSTAWRPLIMVKRLEAIGWRRQPAGDEQAAGVAGFPRP